MTVTSEVSRSGPYNGNGATTVFPYTFKIFTAADLLVTQVSVAGVETTLVLNTDYTVSGVLSDSGGNVTLTTALPGDGTTANSQKLTIRRVLDVTQTMDLRSQGKISAEVLERAHDRAIMLIQQLEDERARSLRLIESETGTDLLTLLPSFADRKGKNLSFDPTTAQPTATSPASAAVSVAMQPVTASATLPLARAAMGVNQSTTIYATDSPYNADPTGVADSTAAINAALLAGAGKHVHIPAGTYKTTGTLVIYGSTHLTGDGQGSTLLVGNITSAMIATDAPASRRYNIVIEDLSVNNTSSANVGGIGIDFRNVTLGRLKNVWAYNCELGLRVDQIAYYNSIEGVQINACVTGIRVAGGANENWFLNTRISAVTTGIYCDGGSNNSFNIGAIENFTNGFNISPVATDQYTKILGFRLENAPTSGTGILIGATNNSTLVVHCCFIGLTTNVNDLSAQTARQLSPDYCMSMIDVVKFRFGTAANAVGINAMMYASGGTIYARNSADSGYAPMDIGATTVRGTLTAVSGNLTASTVGFGVRIKEGSNAKLGTATLVAGSAVVANTSVTATSRILLTSQQDGGTPGFLRVSARTAGTSFTITSSNAADTSTVAYEIIEPG